MMSDDSSTREQPNAPAPALDALNEQIKLLVRTEQRLHQAQRAADRQLARIEALAEFAFRCSSVTSPREIVERTVHLLADVFDLSDCVGFVLGGDDDTMPVALRAGTARPSGAAVEAMVQSVRAVAVVNFARGAADSQETEWAFLGRTPAEGAAVVLCLRDPDGVPRAAVLGWKVAARPSFYLDDLRDAHRAFLFTLAAHAERALQGALLTRALQSRTDELAATNFRLQRSLEDLDDAQAALGAAQKLEALGRLAGGVAHDFNNLLTVILGRVELIKEGLSRGPYADSLDAVLEAAGRAAALSAQLLAFGRKQPHNPTPTDLADAVLETVKVLDPLIGDDISLAIQSEPSAGRVMVDRGQFGQVILNLALNARDAMPGGGRLTISTGRATAAEMVAAGLEPRSHSGGAVAVRVSDSGTGMSPETVDRIFEPFFTTKELGRGTGLGLASAYGLVRQNNGRIYVESELGTGTTFTLVFPAGGPRRLQVDPSGDEARPSILIADDNEAIRSLALQVLGRASYDAVEARDGVEALALMEDGLDVDLLITDVVMPRMGGGELAALARVSRPGLPVLFISGYPFESLELGALDPSLDRYLAKPFTPAHLRTAVADALERSRTCRQSGREQGIQPTRPPRS